MISIPEKQIRKKILDKLNLGICEYIQTPQGITGNYSGTKVNYSINEIVIDYIPTQKNNIEPRVLENKVNINGKDYVVKYNPVEKPKILTGQELTDYYKSLKRTVEKK